MNVQHYRPGTCDKLLKWKPSEKNRIDFRLKVGAWPSAGGACNALTARRVTLGQSGHGEQAEVLRREGQLPQTVGKLMVQGSAGEIEFATIQLTAKDIKYVRVPARKAHQT